MYSTVEIKFLKIFILISKILSPAKLDDQKRFIMNINSMLQKNYIKQTWRIINTSLTQKKIVRCMGNIVNKIIQDDIVQEDSEDIANIFNDYFIDCWIDWGK